MIKLSLTLACILPAILSAAAQEIEPHLLNHFDELCAEMVFQRIDARHLSADAQRALAQREDHYLSYLQQRNIDRTQEVASHAQYFPDYLTAFPQLIKRIEQNEHIPKKSHGKKYCRRLGSYSCNPITAGVCAPFLAHASTFLGAFYFIVKGYSIQNAPDGFMPKLIIENSKLIEEGYELCQSALGESSLIAAIACCVCRDFNTKWYTWLAQDEMPEPIIREEFLAELATTPADELLSDNEELYADL